MFITIIVFLAVLSILVLFHEFGHFYSAKKLGIKVDEFGLGFPPRIFGFYKDKNNKWKIKWGRGKVNDCPGVVYSINAIPIGGFVKIKGEDGENRQDKDSFSSQKVWKRLVVVSAGVLMNIFLAWILISIGFMIGFPHAVDDEFVKEKNVKISDAKVQIVEIIKDSPAERAGLKPLDIILNIDNQEVKSGDDVQSFLNNPEESSLKIKRSGEEQDILITPEFREDLNRHVIGISIADTATIKYPWYLALWEGLKATFIFLWTIIYTFYVVIRDLIVGQSVGVEVAGPVGIANLTGQMARMGIIYLIQFTALLSLNLAVINFFPFPALDGGRFIFLLIEKIKGKPVKQEVEAIIHNSGFALLMLLFVWITLKDLIGLFN
ncbi:MAG: RIP metalloprotease RseP [Patescibacteria group bacterium]